MKTIQLSDEWRAVIDEIERTNEPVALELDGLIHGVLCRRNEAQHLMSRYIIAEPDLRHAAATSERSVTYLDLLQADPTLVPQIDGHPLRFMTIMNSSYIDPQQLYQFDDPQTGEVHIFRANELKQAIGRSFASVEFVNDAMRQWQQERRNG